MSLYKSFKTEENLETNGILVQYGTNSKGNPIIFTLARAGGSNNRFNKTMEHKLKPYRRQIQTETMAEADAQRLIKEVYAETVVLAWEGVEDENDKHLEYSKENCIKLFNDLPDLFTELQGQAQKASLFRKEILEADSKN